MKDYVIRKIKEATNCKNCDTAQTVNDGSGYIVLIQIVVVTYIIAE